MKFLYTLFILTFSLNVLSQIAPIEEKTYYTGASNIVTGWTGPWPVDQLDSIDNICEVIFEANGKPVKVQHLKLNGDGTLKCPAEKDAARIVTQDAVEADAAAMASALKAMSCGRKVKARLLVKNASKGLNNGQKRQIAITYQDIDSLLSAGSLDAAREDILAVTPDGVRVKADDITALVAELDACK